MIKGKLSSVTGDIAIVAARFNEHIVHKLISGAKETLSQYGISDKQIDVFEVPGAWEIPVLCKKLAMTKKYQGIVALGCVIRGATAHFDYVAGCSANGINQVSLEYTIPITNGILTTENLEQAIDRAGARCGNKGSEAATALIEMINLLGTV